MSKAVVSKYCNVLNYVRDSKPEFADIIQGLCVGHMFKPKKGSHALTVLVPSDAALKKLETMTKGDHPEAAIDHIKAMILHIHLENLEAFNANKDNIPNAAGKKLEVTAVTPKKVTLSTGAEVTVDAAFRARDDRQEIAVYVVSDLPPVGEVAAVAAKPSKKVTGGGDYTGSRADLFNRVLKEYCSGDSKRDPALEVLVSLLMWSKSNEELHNAVCSQLSNDTMATLAVVLQPHKNDADGKLMKDSEFAEWSAVCNNKDIPVYVYCAEPVKHYNECMEKGAKLCADLTKHVNEEREALIGNASKVTLINSLTEFYKGAAARVSKCVPRRAVNAKELFAEAELRVISAILHENNNNSLNHDEAASWFAKLNLNELYICGDKSNMAEANIGVYFSTVYLIARSDALLYTPGNTELTGLLSNITGDGGISLNLSMPLRVTDEFYNKNFTAHQAAMEMMMKK